MLFLSSLDSLMGLLVQSLLLLPMVGVAVGLLAMLLERRRSGFQAPVFLADNDAMDETQGLAHPVAKESVFGDVGQPANGEDRAAA